MLYIFSPSVLYFPFHYINNSLGTNNGLTLRSGGSNRRNKLRTVAEEDGYDGGGGGGGGGTVGVSHVYPNRDVLKDCLARGGGARAPGAPLVPPPMQKRPLSLVQQHLYCWDNSSPW